MSEGAAAAATRIRIEPPRGLAALNLGQLWESRELVGFLVWRDVKVRYKQTWLGVAWVAIQPFFTMVVFTLIFGKVGKLPSDEVPYPVMVFTGLLPWQFMAASVASASNSLVGNSGLLQKVYFPRLVMPVAAAMASLVDFAVAFGMLLVIMAYYGVLPDARVIAVLPLVLLTLSIALAIGLWSSALNVKYRDVRYAVPFMLQMWLLASPIAYSERIVPEQWRTLYALNPMVGVVEGFRSFLLGTPLPGVSLALSIAMTALLLVGGLFYFKRAERSFADFV